MGKSARGRSYAIKFLFWGGGSTHPGHWVGGAAYACVLRGSRPSPPAWRPAQPGGPPPAPAGAPGRRRTTPGGPCARKAMAPAEACSGTFKSSAAPPARAPVGRR